MSPHLPARYKACIYDNPGTISTKVVELDMPEPSEGEVLVRLTHSGVCHSDLGVMTSSWAILPEPTPAGQVGGHEGVGEVVKIHQDTADSSPVKVGQRVGIKWISGVCQTCAPCKAGFDNLCVNQKVSGYFTPGTFQQYVLAPANYVTPIPDGLESASAAPLLCAGVTAYSALKKSGVAKGEYVVLMGAGGGLGHIATQIASRGMGMRVIGIDHPSKKDLVLMSGAQHFVDYTTSKDLAADVKALTEDLGAHAVVVLTAANSAYASAIPLLRFRGTLVCVGIPEGPLKPIGTAYPGMLLELEQRIVGSNVGSLKDATEMLELAAKGVVSTHYRLCKMEELTSVFEEMKEGKIQGRVVMDLQ